MSKAKIKSLYVRWERNKQQNKWLPTPIRLGLFSSFSLYPENQKFRFSRGLRKTWIFLGKNQFALHTCLLASVRYWKERRKKANRSIVENWSKQARGAEHYLELAQNKKYLKNIIHTHLRWKKLNKTIRRMASGASEK